MKRVLFFGIVSLIALGVLVPRASADATVYVGYADDLRPTPFFPTSPWSGSPNVTFIGNATNVDAGAIRIDNAGASNIVITDITVNINGSGLGDIWAGSMPITITPGHILIVTQTSPYNFDTSDVHFVTTASAPCLDSVTAPCTTHPTFTVTFMGGATATFDDTGHVLDTGGFDLALANRCPNPADQAGQCNESLNWRLVGTTGIGNPGGNTPEPASLILLSTGIASLAMRRRKQA